jgi:regulator of CtrA degradation
MAEEVIKFRVEQAPVALGPRLAGREAFQVLFDEGMALVEETADYLDGDGRKDSLRLSRAGALAYASESMRLTTRLMQIASWLLLQRAVNDGELSDQQARAEKDKVRLTGLSTATQGSGWEGLPNRLQALIVRSLRLQARVQRLDGAFGADGPPQVVNPVGEQIVRIADAFAARR